MNYSDFEPINSRLMSNKMLRRNIPVPNYQQQRVIVKPVERRMKMEEQQYSAEGETAYPESNDKKVLGMTPKTIAISLGIIVIAIFVINMTGQRQDIQPPLGGAIV